MKAQKLKMQICTFFVGKIRIFSHWQFYISNSITSIRGSYEWGHHWRGYRHTCHPLKTRTVAGFSNWICGGNTRRLLETNVTEKLPNLFVHLQNFVVFVVDKSKFFKAKRNTKIVLYSYSRVSKKAFPVHVSFFLVRCWKSWSNKVK